VTSLSLELFAQVKKVSMFNLEDPCK